ncbi:MAG: hypothetical protein ACRDRV_20970, partial [Pseudonocardiaceae bacterium]
ALAFSPVAGQGLRFAVASALAAATVLNSWKADSSGEADSSSKTLARDYYRSFVEGARTRHLAKLATLGIVDAPAARTPRAEVLGPHTPLRFTAGIERAGVSIGGRIVADDCCVLPDGGLVRWAGGFDLLRLRTAVAEGRTWTQVCAALAAAGVPDSTAQALIIWALRAGVLTAGSRG